MERRTVGFAVAAGLASFLVTFVAVSELLSPYVEFSVLVGLPAGVVVGAGAAAVVLWRRDAEGRRRAPAVALGTFGVVHLCTAVVLVGLRFSVTSSLVGATLVGLLAGIGAFAAARR